ncbi:MAG: energy transducer TonB [Flavobacteriales bacterium]|nr:energy transducer TonB [Flavobacteriales bacterium]
MKLRHSLPLLAALFAPALFAQTETIPGRRAVTRRADVDVEEQDPDTVFVIAEEMPTFPGGQEAMMKFIGSKIRYPKEAVDNGIQGTVFVTFVVERDGSITGVKTLRGIGSGCDEEALRVVQSMPKWIPGKQRGKEVRVQYNLPIRFKL